MPDRAWTLQRLEAALAGLPTPEFRARLRADLQRRSTMTTDPRPSDATASTAAPYVHTAARPTAAPVLRLRGAAKAIDFYARAFGAREVMRFAIGDQIPHAEIEIGDALIILADENATIGFPGPDTLGGSPVTIRLDVDDPDAAVARAVAAGAAVFLPVQTHFYGERSGTVVDPFGYRWGLTKVVEPMTVEEMHRRMMAAGGPAPNRRDWVPEGYRDLTPYLVVQDVPAVVAFARAVFDAEETRRAIGSAGGYHAEVRIGDSMLMIGGGGPDVAWRGESKTTPLHVYVPDVDAVYARAVAAGARTTHEPREMEYGDRECGFEDPGGNVWYVATHHDGGHVPAGLGTVTPFLHPRRADTVIAFLTRAFGATTMMRYATPDGVVHHAAVRIGGSVVEMGDAHGPHQPTPSMFHLYVPDVDAAYHRALEAGGASLTSPADQPYGVRQAGVTDPFGHQWYLARPIPVDNR
ncbi:MAG TPA: VOC family protein [Vicinamibacterales bacterium]|nr:VOC family protein [Vicinamibacterales bacterium]